jgi:hypothetical protein
VKDFRIFGGRSFVGIEGGMAEFSEAVGLSSSSLPIRVNPVHLRLKIQIRVWGL